jgi:hypothetical protein
MNLILNPAYVTGTVSVTKNSNAYLTRNSTGNTSGILATGDTFVASLSAAISYARQLTVESSTRGVLYDVATAPDEGGFLNYEDTRQAGEDIIVSAGVVDFG